MPGKIPCTFHLDESKAPMPFAQAAKVASDDSDEPEIEGLD